MAIHIVPKREKDASDIFFTFGEKALGYQQASWLPWDTRPLTCSIATVIMWRVHVFILMVISRMFMVGIW